MPACQVCQHRSRAGIDQALVGGEPHRSVAKRYGLSDASVFRHQGSHIPKALSVAQGVKLEAHGASLLEQVTELKSEAKRIGRKAEDGGDLRTALLGIREMTRLIELMAKVSGELQETINLVAAPEWEHIRACIIAALQPYPEALAAVVGALDA